MSSNIRITRICQFCGNSFTAKTTVTKFCGDRCAKAAYKLRKKEEKISHSNTETSRQINHVYPTEEEKERLKELILSNNKGVALYSWANLRGLNDTHIMAAAYLNVIGDVYVHCRQASFGATWENEYIEDLHGNSHTVRKFKEYKDLEKCLLESEENNVYFDIDLDFFTLINPLQPRGGRGNYTYLPDKTIKEMLHHTHPLMQWIFQRLHGITIATEPEHTGGLMESNRLLSLINQIWFKPSLFTKRPGRWEKETQWRHLRDKKKSTK